MPHCIYRLLRLAKRWCDAATRLEDRRNASLLQTDDEAELLSIGACDRAGERSRHACLHEHDSVSRESYGIQTPFRLHVVESEDMISTM